MGMPKDALEHVHMHGMACGMSNHAYNAWTGVTLHEKKGWPPPHLMRGNLALYHI